jgi:hypothetical protein
MDLSSPEIKLILRLRQLRKSNETSMFMVTTTPLTLAIMGHLELLETTYSSGSGGFG